MILSDKTIKRMLDEKSLIIEPCAAEQIQPASVDIRLGSTFSVVEDTPSGIITLNNEIKYRTITTDTYLIMPGQFVLEPRWNTLSCPMILPPLWKGAAPLEEWACSFKTRAGSIPASRAK